MKINLHYTDDAQGEKSKEFDHSGGTQFDRFLSELENVSYFHNTTNMIWRIRGVKDGKDCILGYFVTDRNKHHKYASPYDKLKLAQLGADLYATGEKYENINIHSLDFLQMFNELKEKDQRKTQNEIRKFDRVISDQVRFGFGYRLTGGEKQYYAWHGLPNKNDDYITTAEISEAEFNMIQSEYPVNFAANKEQASAFRKKYVHAHKVLLEGWNKFI